MPTELPGVQHITNGPAVDTLGLVHRVRLPNDTHQKGPHPTLVMVHGLQGNEDVTWIFARAVGPEWLVISPRAPYEADEGFRWNDLTPDANSLSPLFESGKAALQRFIERLPEVYPVDPTQILLLGFSQGAAASYTQATSFPGSVIGVAALSGFIPAPIANHLPDLNGLPVLILHGTKDETISIDVARNNRDQLIAAGAAVTYEESEVGHKISSAGMTTLKAWIKARI